MPEDYLNSGTRPTSVNGEEYAYIGARATFEIDGYTFADTDVLFMDFGSVGPMKAILYEPPLVSGSEMEWGENILVTPGTLAAFEQYVAEQRNRDRLTLPQLDGLRWSADELKASFDGMEYISGTIKNERDIPAWAADAAKRTVGWEIVGLTENGEFAGDKRITRDEFTAYVARAFGLMTTGRDLNFSDVPLSNEFRREILAAYENGIIGGVGDNKFAPGALLTREQASTIIYRAMVAVLGAETVKKAAAGNTAFRDAARVSGYARQAVQDMANAGILTGMGDGYFRPEENFTLAQTAVVLDRIIRTFIL
jgi:hypothetical protein